MSRHMDWESDLSLRYSYYGPAVLQDWEYKSILPITGRLTLDQLNIMQKARSAATIKTITTSQLFLSIWRIAENSKFWTGVYPTWSERRSECWFSYEDADTKSETIRAAKIIPIYLLGLSFYCIPKPLYWPGNQTYIFLIPVQNPCHPKHHLDPCNPRTGFAFTGRELSSMDRN